MLILDLSEMLLFKYGLDLFQPNHAGQTILEVARLNPGSYKYTFPVLKRMHDMWNTVILPELLRLMATSQPTGMPKELADLALQYLDGHGCPLDLGEESQRSEDSNEMEL